MIRDRLLRLARFVALGSSLLMFVLICLIGRTQYQSHVPVLSEGSCFFYNFSETVLGIQVDEPSILYGIVLENNLSTGQMTVLTDQENGTSIPFTVKYSDIRYSGYIQVRCIR